MPHGKLLSAETVRELFHQWSRRLPLRIGNGVKAEFLSVIDQAPDETPQPPDVAAIKETIVSDKTLADVQVWTQQFEDIVEGNHARRRCRYCHTERWVKFETDGAAHDATPHDEACPKRALARFIGWEPSK